MVILHQQPGRSLSCWLLNPGKRSRGYVQHLFPWGPFCLSEGPAETLVLGSLQLMFPIPFPLQMYMGTFLPFSVDRPLSQSRGKLDDGVLIFLGTALSVLDAPLPSGSKLLHLTTRHLFSRNTPGHGSSVL